MKKKSLILILCLVLCVALCACKSKEVKAAESAIDAIGTVTLESGDAIASAEDLYEAVPEEEKAEVENYNDLLVARETYDELRATETEDAINAIGTVSLDSKGAITTARNLYNALNADQKKLVGNLADLEAAEEELAFLEKFEANRITNYKSMTPTYANAMDYSFSTWYSGKTNRAIALVLLQLQAMGVDWIEAESINFNAQYIGRNSADGRLDFYAPYGNDGTIMGIQYWPGSGKAQLGTIKTDLSINEYLELMVDGGVIDEYVQVDLASIRTVLNALT